MPDRLPLSDPAVQQALGRRTGKRRCLDRLEASASLEGTAIVFRIQRELRSPNFWNGAHWTVKHRETQEWQRAFEYALAMSSEGHIGRLLLESVWAITMRRLPQRIRVEIERHVPNARRFIRDDDNLRFTSKPVLDALKRLGYIHNDSRKWLEHSCPTQHVSADGHWWTIIRVEARAEV